MSIKVELVSSCCTDLDTVNAARVSFDKESGWAEDVWAEDEQGLYLANVLTKEDEKLIKYLASHKHLTPFRHNFVKIRVKAPIFLAAQLKKHQAGLSWNEVSRRYVSSEPEFYTPDVWRGKPEGSIKQGSAGAVTEMKDSGWGYEGTVAEHYEEHVDGCLNIYEDMLAAGVAPEMARMVLPQSMMTEWIWSGNLLAFAHIFNERKASGAQQEAQDFAWQLHKAVSELAPVSWEALTK